MDTEFASIGSGRIWRARPTGLGRGERPPTGVEAGLVARPEGPSSPEPPDSLYRVLAQHVEAQSGETCTNTSKPPKPKPIPPDTIFTAQIETIDNDRALSFLTDLLFLP
jgi:hypothetical protein